MTDQIRVRSARGIFREWTEVEVARRIDAVSGEFRLGIGLQTFEGTSLSDKPQIPLQPGDQVVVETAPAGGGTWEPLITGAVDALQIVGDARQLRLIVSGRDKAADLVDCSATNEPGEWSSIAIHKLAEELAAPFGIEVVIDTLFSSEPFEPFKLQHGETPWSALERAARARGVLFYSDGRGRVLLSSPGALGRSDVGLLEGVKGNVLSWRYSHTQADRFRVYIVRGQAKGSDDAWGESVAAIEGRAEDLGIGRFRPLVVISEGQVTFSGAADRAQWEAIVRAARSTGLEVEVVGWRKTPNGPIWQPNELVAFRISSIGLSGELLVEGVHYKRSELGTIARLHLVRPDAYKAQPTIPQEADPLDLLPEDLNLEFDG